MKISRNRAIRQLRRYSEADSPVFEFLKPILRMAADALELQKIEAEAYWQETADKKKIINQRNVRVWNLAGEDQNQMLERTKKDLARELGVYLMECGDLRYTVEPDRMGGLNVRVELELLKKRGNVFLDRTPDRLWEDIQKLEDRRHG